MSGKRNPEGVVLAMAVPHQCKAHAAAGQQTTVYWRGPDTPALWSTHQSEAVRFADDALAHHVLGVAAGEESHPKRRGARVWCEPALHARNGGPRGEVITAWPPGVAQPLREEQVQGELFGTTS